MTRTERIERVRDQVRAGQYDDLDPAKIDAVVRGIRQNLAKLPFLAADSHYENMHNKGKKDVI